MTKRRDTPLERSAMLTAIPSNWLDPLLTGPDKVIGKPPYDCRDIEKLLNAIMARVYSHAAATKKGKRK